MDRTPRGYEARIAAEAGTAAARKADREREAITGRIPHLDILDGSDDAAELHGAPQRRWLIGVSTRSSRYSSFTGNEHVYWRYPMSAGDTGRKRARHSRRAQVKGGENAPRQLRQSQASIVALGVVCWD